MFDGIKAAVVKDRPAYFKDFLDNFYNVDVLRPARISDQAWQNSFIAAVQASARAAYACVDTRLPGLIKDLTFVTVEGGPHNIGWTHPDVVNPAPLDFLAK